VQTPQDAKNFRKPEQVTFIIGAVVELADLSGASCLPNEPENLAFNFKEYGTNHVQARNTTARRVVSNAPI
jgi:hypothetical protein